VEKENEKVFLLDLKPIRGFSHGAGRSSKFSLFNESKLGYSMSNQTRNGKLDELEVKDKKRAQG
jgi:hypothetical protein